MLPGLQAKHIAEELSIVFEDGSFNFSSKWLYKFKLANDINRVRLHGEGADADKTSVAIVRRQLPAVLSGIPPHKIYNFDETGDPPSPPLSLCLPYVCKFLDTTLWIEFEP